MLPTRERIVRAAKERAVENLHELTTKGSLSPAKASLSSTSVSTTANMTKRNQRSYKPFAEQAAASEDEASEQEGETPKKTAGRQRRKTGTAQKDTATKSSRVKQHQRQQQPVDADQLTDPTSSSLFNQVYQGQVSLQSVVDDLIELYKKDRDTAMLDLIKFIVRCSGCKAGQLLTNRRDVLRSKEFADSINELIENFNGEEAGGDEAAASEVYPLVQTSVQARRFYKNFCEFLQLLINQCQYSIIYDQFMLDVLITFLIGLADSQVRAFRHTATLAVLKIMTALVDVLLSLSIAKDACQRQYDNERGKSQAKRAADRIEMLIGKRKEIEENEYEIQNFINFIFKAVFIHRYRDVCADIRCICINEIGEWMRKCPEKFLDDTFLKYIGWTLYDKVGECRMKCLQALQPLYEAQDLQSKLELFTSRFKNRVVEMSLDKETDVAVNAIRLLTTIVRQRDEALEDKDCENLYELVYHTNRQVAQAAGEFLNQKLFVKAENSLIEFKRGKKSSENASFIQLLVQFLIESELHDHPTYLVDAMWDLHPMLKDWECMTDLLLEDPVDPAEGMSDTHERFLVETMVCCVKQAATGEYPVARRHQANRKLNAKEAKQVQDDKVSLTQHFMATLPDLLTKYIADAEKLVHLLQIPLHFDLHQYTLRRQEKSLDKLLRQIQDIVSKHNEYEVLEQAALCLACLCEEDNPNYTRCNVTRSAILDNLVDQFTRTMKAVEELSEVDDSEIFPLMVALKRLAAFAEYHDIGGYDLVKNTFTILKWVNDNEGFAHDFFTKALTLARSIINWHLNKLNVEVEEGRNATIVDEAEADGGEVAATAANKEQIEFVAKLSKKYYKICSKLLVNDNPLIEEEAFFELCDLFILFNMHIGSVHREFKSLILECTTNDIYMLSVYVMSHVFTAEALTERPDTAENIERLHKRRSLLAAFCKLINFNCIPIKFAAEIFRGYAKYASSYGDIIKNLLGTCREISKVNTARTIALALQREYNEAVLTTTRPTSPDDDSAASSAAVVPNRFDRNSAEFTALRELVHKFILSFGPEASVKSREAIVAIHQESIRFAGEPVAGQPVPKSAQQAPINLPFLEIIVEFSSRLTPHDKKLVLAELDKAFAKRANKLEENNWQAYYTYRVTLMEDYHPPAASNQTNRTTAAAAVNQTNEVVISVALTSLVNGADLTANKTRRRGRQSADQNGTADSFNVSGVVRLKDSINDRSNRRKHSAINGAAKQVIDDVIDEEEVDEEIENIQKNFNSENFNNHTDSTLNGLDTLKLNAESTRITRSTKTLPTSNGVASAALARNSPNKRSRSPLVSTNSNNNTIDESLIMSEANCVLTSTRIEPHRLSRGATVSGIKTRCVVGINAISRNANYNDLEQSEILNETSDETATMESPAKRKRKSEENNGNENSVNGGNGKKSNRV